MTNSTALRTAAVLGLLAVVLGAFGAHGLKDLLGRNGTGAIWEKAVFYHFIHALMLFVLAQRPSLHLGPWVSFLIGIVVFSGTLVHAVTLVRLTARKWSETGVMIAIYREISEIAENELAETA